jgi:hypothetical protein
MEWEFLAFRCGGCCVRRWEGEVLPVDMPLALFVVWVTTSRLIDAM